jgi:hypothetical protein
MMTRRAVCDSCLVAPATVDHLDFAVGEARLANLCGACAEAELARWHREKQRTPALAGPGRVYDNKDERPF